MPLRLGVNIDHVATIRNARGGAHPCPVRAALLAAEAGADGITAHLREDRRHIRDEDMRRLKAEVPLPLNFEMAATEEMRAIALEIRPHAVCLVPEKREERTTEGGLEVAGQQAALKEYIAPLAAAGIRVSLFIEPDPRQVEAAAAIAARAVELHTGKYAELFLSTPSPASGGEGGGGQPAQSAAEAELSRLHAAAARVLELGMECHAGHGLNFENVAPVAAIPQVVELNIGHFLVGEAIFTGLSGAIAHMRRRMGR